MRTSTWLIAAPTNLSATIASATRINLSWTDSSSNENSFAVWRSVNGAAPTQVGTVTRTNAQSTATGGNVTFANTGLTAGNTYAYFVTAVRTAAIAGTSVPSNTVTVLFTVPAAPSGVVAVGCGGQQQQCQGNLELDRQCQQRNRLHDSEGQKRNVYQPTGH